MTKPIVYVSIDFETSNSCAYVVVAARIHTLTHNGSKSNILSSVFYKNETNAVIGETTESIQGKQTKSFICKIKKIIGLESRYWRTLFVSYYQDSDEWKFQSYTITNCSKLQSFSFTKAFSEFAGLKLGNWPSLKTLKLNRKCFDPASVFEMKSRNQKVNEW